MFTARDLPGRGRRGRGLTLLEVVVGLAILGLMAGAIYAIVSGSVESTAALALTQTEDRRVETFLHRTRQALSHLPAGATVELKLLEGDPLRQELILRGVPDAYLWGPDPRWEKPDITLSPRPWDLQRKAPVPPAQGRGQSLPPAERYALCLSVPDFFRTTEDGEPVPESPLQSRQGNQFLKPDLQGRFWLELLPEVDRVEWRFYDPAKKLWLELSPPARPPLIELKLFLPGRHSAVRAVFSIN